MITEGPLTAPCVKDAHKESQEKKCHHKMMSDDTAEINPLSPNICQQMTCYKRIYNKMKCEESLPQSNKKKSEESLPQSNKMKCEESLPQSNKMKCEESLPQSNMEVDKTSGTFETGSIKAVHSILFDTSLLSTNKQAGVVIDLNPNHLTSAEKESYTSAHLDPVTGSHSTNSLMSQPTTSTDHTQAEPVSHSTIEKDTMSFGQRSSASGPGAQVTGHGGDEPSGARPKLVAARTTKNGTKSKNVRWSEETQIISTIDATTYEHYRKCLLELSVPTTVEKNAAVEAVLFMSDKESRAHLTLVIDMVFKFLWAKEGSCPNALKLYGAICDFKYDETNVVAAFHKMCQTTSEKPAATAEQLHSLPCTAEPLRALETAEQLHSLPCTEEPLRALETAEQLHSLPCTAEPLRALETAEQLHSLPCTAEPLRALDFQDPAHISQVDNNLPQLRPCAEVRHETSENNMAASLICSEIEEKHHKKLQTQAELKHEQVYALLREQEHLKASTRCILCRKNQIEITLLPCGHFVLCAACSENCNVCPVCNKQALAEVKTFLC